MSNSYIKSVQKSTKINSNISSKKWVNIIAPAILILVIFILWELIVDVFKIPLWAVSKPTGMFMALITEFKTIIYPQILATIQVMLIGYIIGVVIGIVLGGVLSNFVIIAQAANPYVILLVCTPLMTLVPLMMIWLGFGLLPRLVAVILQTFPINLMNTATGFLNVSTERRELMMSMKANRVETFFRVLVPSALPDIFTGMKLGCIFAVTTTIATEFIGGDKGLGAEIIKDTQFMRTDLAFACILVVAIISVILYGAVSLTEKYIIRWKE